MRRQILAAAVYQHLSIEFDKEHLHRYIAVGLRLEKYVRGFSVSVLGRTHPLCCHVFLIKIAR